MSWPNWLQHWRSRMGHDRDIADEIHAHLEMAAARYMADGMSADEARLRARREFGNIAEVRQLTRHVWRWAWLEQLGEDVRFGVRILWASPSVSLTAITLIALVIGGNTTVYSLARMVLTSPAAGVTAEQLVTIVPTRPASDEPFMSYPDFRDIANASETLDHPAAWTTERLLVEVNGATHAVSGALVTGAFFDVLGVHPRDGRVLTPGDDNLSDHGLVVVISERFWRDYFDQAHAAVGQHLLINDQPATIVGIAAAGFRGAVLTPGEDLWVPLVPYYRAIGSEASLENRAQPMVLTVAALPAGRSREATQMRIGTVAARLAKQFPESHAAQRLLVLPYSATSVLPISRMSGAFLALLAAVMVVTVLAVSANVANLMLVRALARQREVALRQAMGATRGRIVRLLAFEGLTVAIVAWILASATAWGMARALLRTIGPASGNAMDGFTPDWSLVLYAMVLALGSTVAFTVLPGLQTWRQPVLPWLKSGEQPVAGGRSRAMNVLVVAQFAFSVMLLTSAGLGYRSFTLAESNDLGFNPDGLLFVTVRAGGRDALVDTSTTSAEHDRTLARLERARERILANGSMTAATYVRRLPGAYLNVLTPVERQDGTSSQAIRRVVGPGYLTTLGVSPLLGRDFAAADTRNRPRVAIVNRHLAQALWPEASPIGQLIRVGSGETAEIVGVTPNLFFDGPSHDARPQYVFIPELQNEGPPIDVTILARHDGPARDAATVVGGALGETDPPLPIVATATMADRLAQVTQNEQTITRLLLVFAGLSLLVATLGLYAVAAFNAGRRVREFGVRLALGATLRDIGRDVLGSSVRMAGLGVLLGSATSAALAALAGSRFIGVSPVDPSVHATVVLVLAIVSVLAAIGPALRACRIDVVGVLRQE